MDILGDYEKVRSLLGCVLVTSIGVVVIAFGVHLLKAPVRHLTTKGTVTSYTSQTNMINVSYTVNGNVYYLTTSGQIGVGSNVDVLYDANNPSNARLTTQMSNKKFGAILIGVSVLVMALTYLGTYFVFKSKTFAEVTGGLDVASQVASIV